jgi:thioredoxin-related protein
MKIILVSLLIVFACHDLQAQSSVPSTADDIMGKAYAQSKKENKKVFVMFHASWCVWCRKMDTSMNDPSCKKFFENNFVIRHLVVDESKDKKQLENPGASDLRDKYYGKDEGIPYWLIFDSNGKLLYDSKVRKDGEAPEKGENVGCPASEKEVAYFIDVLKKTTSLKATDLEIIRKRFRKNEL